LLISECGLLILNVNAQELKERTKQFALRVMRGRSKAEFVSKLGVAEEEADETALWLELIIADRLLPEKKVDSLLREANELTAILAASYISASRAQQTMSRNSQSEIRSQKSAIRT
jgi:hypothetical protein